MQSHLYPDLCVDNSINDQLWFSFASLPDVRFCGVYITPSSSPYFSESDIANLQAKTVDDSKKYVIIGDLNARVGEKVNELVSHTATFKYTMVDPGINDNGKKVLAVCKDRKLLVVNNLSTGSSSFPGGLTYRTRNKWISQLDLCIVSEDLIPCVSHFDVNQDTTLPSNHAPVSVRVTFPEERLSPKQVLIRSSDIGTYPTKQTHLCKRPISFERIDTARFTENMSSLIPPLVAHGADFNSLAEEFGEILYNSISESKEAPIHIEHQHDPSTTRWERIMNCGDDGLLWKAIDWKGRFNPEHTDDTDNQPSEAEFQEHLEKLLNPGDEAITTDLSNYHTTIPVLDNVIPVKEVADVIAKQVNPNTGCGPDGNSPGAFKLLPRQWMSFLCLLFNIVFVAGYPLAWSSAKLIMLFKKGIRTDCNNYRGISVTNAVSKIYDYVLNNRLMSWYVPCREQAGAQPERGCIEHVVTLRLLFNVFVRKKQKLFVVFVDFRKAYDLVPRSKLFDILIDLGCGVTMLGALIAMYTNTTSILGSTIITSTIGVRQGSPTSCYLFIIFVDVLILLIKSKCSPEPILGWLHTLMLMDDTVILATSREKMAEKLKLLDEYCTNSGMRINESKTKLMVINGTPIDKVSFPMSTIIVKHCDSYVYLGVVFTADGKCLSSLQEHLNAKNRELNKLLIFFATNYDAPFEVKKRVLEAAFLSTILYGCESWLKVPLKTVEVMYMKAVRALLGVRATTPTNLCLLEGGLKPLESLVKSRQKKFFEKMMTKRADMTDDPLMHAINITKELNRPMWSYVESVLSVENFPKMMTDAMKESIQNAAPSATRSHTYLALNPELDVHPLYTKKSSTIPDYLRISFTRYRLSSHMLRVEIGRWSRTPRDERMCPCRTGIQDESHIFMCPLVTNTFTKPCRTPADLFQDTSFNDLDTLHKTLNSFHDANVGSSSSSD